MQVNISEKLKFLHCKDTTAYITPLGGTLYRLTTPSGYKQTIKQSEFDAIMALNKPSLPQGESSRPSRQPLNRKDELEQKTKEELISIACEFYVESEIDKRLGKDKLIELILEAEKDVK